MIIKRLLKKEEAQSIISHAKSRLKKKTTEVENYAKEVEKQIQDYYDFKLALTKTIMGSTKVTLEKIDFNHFVRKLDAPTMIMAKDLSTTKFSKALTFTGSSLASGALRSIRPFAKGTLISMMNQKNRVHAANDFLEEAKDYRQQVDYEIAQLNALKAKMKSISLTVKEETDLLNMLFGKLDQMMEDIKSFQSKKSLTEQELERVKGLINIANILYYSIQTTFISKDLEISPNYTKEMDKLKTLIHSVADNL